MAYKKRSASSKRPARDLEQEITDRVIEALERGTVPWSKPWTAAGHLPTSITTGKPYRGINVWLLSMAAASAGYGSPLWMTFNQANAHGGTVRKGEKGTTVVFWKLLKIRDDKAVEPDAMKSIPLMRAYSVFNLDQTEGVVLPPRFTYDTEREPVALDEAVGEIIDGYVDGPSLRYVRGDSANYNPRTDTITLPERDQFADSVGLAYTTLHELTHSTGHPSRLDRFQRTGEPQHFGTERYAREELLAEMGAAMLATIAGLDYDLDRSAAYIGSWLEALRNDKALVIKAAQAAQKAVDRITGTTAAESAPEAQEGEAA